MTLTTTELITLICSVISAICAVIAIVNAKATQEIKQAIENKYNVKQTLSKDSTITITTNNPQ